MSLIPKKYNVYLPLRPKFGAKEQQHKKNCQTCHSGDSHNNYKFKPDKLKAVGFARKTISE